MSLTEAAVFVALRAAVLAITGLEGHQVIRGHQDLPQSQDPYIALRRVTNAGVGRTVETSPGVYRQHRALTVQVDAIGQATEPLLATHSLLSSRSPILDALRSVGVGVARVGGARDLTRRGPQGWERMLGFDVALSYVSELSGSSTPAVDRILVSVQSDGDESHGPSVVVDTFADPTVAAFLSLAESAGLLGLADGLSPL